MQVSSKSWKTKNHLSMFTHADECCVLFDFALITDTIILRMAIDSILNCQSTLTQIFTPI